MVPSTVGPSSGSKIDFDSLKEGYFKAMGWDTKSGKPDRATIDGLGLQGLVADL